MVVVEDVVDVVDVVDKNNNARLSDLLPCDIRLRHHTFDCTRKMNYH